MQDLHSKVPGGEVLGQLGVDAPVSGEQRAQPPRVAPRVPSEEAGAAVGEEEVAQEAAVPHLLVPGEVLRLQQRHHRPGQLGQDGEHGVHVPLHRRSDHVHSGHSVPHLVCRGGGVPLLRPALVRAEIIAAQLHRDQLPPDTCHTCVM